MLTGLVATSCALNEGEGEAQMSQAGVLVGNAVPPQIGPAQTGMNDEHRLVPNDFRLSTQQELGLTDTLPQYAAKCDAAIGITVPDFNCDNGTLVPTTNYANGKCDRPNRLNQECDPNSRFQVLANTTDAYIVAHCRKKGLGAGHYGDIAVIQHNNNTGATCFYQALGDLDGNVKAPSKGSSVWPWYSPASTASIQCVRCHDNGPIIRSPYLTQLTGTNKLPGAGEFSFNSNQPYSFVGEDFASWKAYKVEVSGNTCNGCHRMGVSNMFGYDDGVALDLGIRATAMSETAKNPHSLASPIWMTPGQIYYDADNAAAAQEIRNCALRRMESPLPNSSTCRITQYSLDPAPPPTQLALQNGWTNAPYSTRNAGVALVSGLVQFKGAIANGIDPVAFTLPSAFRPLTNVYVPVDLCNAHKGRLFIQPTGVVSVQAEGAFSDAQCFTSLEGASFALSAASFTALILGNGWTDAPFSTRNAAVTNVGGIVHLEGAIASGTPSPAFTLPIGFRPVTDVYVPVGLCGAHKGRLYIQPTGVVSVETEGAFSDAQCFTSLEGASFALSAASFTALALQNGWTNAPYSTRNAAVTNVGGIVHLEGAIASGTPLPAFTLPIGFRPVADVYVPVGLCNAHEGRLYIQPTGVVSVQTEGTFSDAQCFTSLEGTSFAL